MINVLLIDDSEIIRLSIKKYLPKKNQITVVSCSSEYAATVLKTNKIDVVLIEYFLKIEGGGLRLIKELKQEYPTLKILGYSDIATENNEELILKAGAIGYLDKSLSIKEIRDAIITLMI